MKKKVLACLVVLTMVGAGVVYGAAAKKCATCKGKGSVVAEKNVKCWSCDGKGKVTCSTCNGSQLIRKNEGTFNASLFKTGCPDCKVLGTATGKQKCGSCNGKGKSDRTEQCWACKGTGKG